MTVQVDTTDEGALTGFILSLDGRNWIRFRSTDGHCFFAVPTDSSNSGYQAASTLDCTCDEHQLLDTWCAHIWAVRFHILREQGEDFLLAPCDPALGVEAYGRSGRGTRPA